VYDILFLVVYSILVSVVSDLTATYKIIRSLPSLIRELSNTKNLLKKLHSQVESDSAKLSQERQLGEKNLQEELDALKQGLFSNLIFIQASTQAAQSLANDECPRLLRSEWEKQEEVLRSLASQIDDAISQGGHLRLLASPWSDSRWKPSMENPESYYPQTTGLAPGCLRVGQFLIERELDSASVAALVPVRSLSLDPNNLLPGHIVIFSNDAESRQAAISAIESISLRVISTFPVRKMQGVFIDPISMGNSFPFKSLPRSIVGQQTFTRSEDVREQLNKLTVHTEQVIQNYLSRYYETIEEYNGVKGAIEEAYRYLFVADLSAA
jgi:DNA segregation ATPase FtsK/SpoIIIE, S-DNA-T family